MLELYLQELHVWNVLHGYYHDDLLLRRTTIMDAMASPLLTNTVWKDYRSRLVRFVRSRVHDEQAAEDIVHDALVKALAKRDTLRDEDRILSWLFQIAMNSVRDHYRAKRPTVSLDEEFDVMDEADPSTLKELAACMEHMMNHLPEPYQSTIRRSELDGVPMRVIAEETGVSLSGIKSRVQRGRAQLRDMMMDCCRIEAGEHECRNPECNCSAK